MSRIWNYVKVSMKIELIPLNDANKEDCFRLKVSEAQAENIATNASSFEAKYGVVIYADGIAVGFTMFAFDLACEDPNDRYWLWRFMIDEKYQGRGYGKEALNNIVTYFRENGATNIRLSTKESNVNAIRLYKSVGFRPTGEVIDGETVFELKTI